MARTWFGLGQKNIHSVDCQYMMVVVAADQTVLISGNFMNEPGRQGFDAISGSAQLG